MKTRPDRDASGRRYRRSPRGRFTNVLAQAKRRGLDCDLDAESYFSLIAKPCHYCDYPLDTSGVGLDRIDGDEGYTKANVVPCCGSCNVTRGFMWTHDEMIHIGTVLKEIKNRHKVTGKSRMTKLLDFTRRNCR